MSGREDVCHDHCAPKASTGAAGAPDFAPGGEESCPNLSATQERKLRHRLTTFIEKADFPCVGAKAALARASLHIETAWSIASAWDDLRIHGALVDWSNNYAADPQGLRSFAVVFSGPLDLDECAFEAALWDRLQSLIAKDGWLGHDYDPNVSSDPNDPHFSLSFGGQAYFAVGLHPHASRKARRMPCPTIIFNLHDQFERLRAEHKYERMRQTILTRDAALDGEPNPMLARHGEKSEARQYSGRVVDDDWRCPLEPGVRR